jgi:hypothetical protein
MKNKICKADTCSSDSKVKGLCLKHYAQKLKHGKLLKRTIYDKNEYVFEGDTCKMFLYNKRNEKFAETIIDSSDYEKVKNLKWGLSVRGYVENGSRKVRHKLHRFLLGQGKESKLEVDHINGNPLDNRKINLRLCTHQQNSQKRRLQANNTSGAIGVSWDRQRKKYMAQLKVNGKKVFFKRVKTFLDAMILRDEAARKYHGEYAKTNKSLGLY